VLVFLIFLNPPPRSARSPAEEEVLSLAARHSFKHADFCSNLVLVSNRFFVEFNAKLRRTNKNVMLVEWWLVLSVCVFHKARSPQLIKQNFCYLRVLVLLSNLRQLGQFYKRLCDFSLRRA